MSSSRIADSQARQSIDALLFRATSQNLSKSSDSKTSAAFSKALEDAETATSGTATATSAAINTAARQDLVAAPSNSHTAEPAAIAAPVQPLVTTQAETAETETTAAATAAVSASGPPTMYTPNQTPSTDPGVYSTNSYIEQLNLSGYEQQANDQNNRLYQNYLNEFQNWQFNGSQGTAPQAPQYEAVNQSDFSSWWSQYQANIVSGNGAAPDVSMFLSNAPGATS